MQTIASLYGWTSSPAVEDKQNSGCNRHDDLNESDLITWSYAEARSRIQAPTLPTLLRVMPNVVAKQTFSAPGASARAVLIGKVSGKVLRPSAARHAHALPRHICPNAEPLARDLVSEVRDLCWPSARVLRCSMDTRLVVLLALAQMSCLCCPSLGVEGRREGAEMCTQGHVEWVSLQPLQGHDEWVIVEWAI